MKIFLSGPMSGLPAFNYPAFERAASFIRSRGHDCLNPAETDEDTSLDRSYYMRAALMDLLVADALVYLPGSEYSEGATTERRVAKALDLPVWSMEHFKRKC